MFLELGLAGRLPNVRLSAWFKVNGPCEERVSAARFELLAGNHTEVAIGSRGAWVGCWNDEELGAKQRRRVGLCLISPESDGLTFFLVIRE